MLARSSASPATGASSARSRTPSSSVCSGRSSALFAGALYGLWAGRAVSARRLKGVGPLLPPDSSVILAWADGAALRSERSAHCRRPTRRRSACGSTPSRRARSWRSEDDDRPEGGLMHAVVMLAYSVHWGGFKWTGSYTTVDLIAASTNALNGALLARRPDHLRGFTVVGIILMALLGGLGGGITRDVLVAKIPSALTNPAYITLALVFGIAGYLARLQGRAALPGRAIPVHDLVLASLVRDHGRLHRREGRPAGARLPAPRRRRLDRRPLLHRHHERRAAEAVHPRRVVRRDRGPDQRWCGSSAPRRARRLGVDRDLVRRSASQSA